MTRQKGANLMHFLWKSRFSHDAPKRCKFIALLRRKAGFLMTRQNLLYFMHYYMEKQIFPWRAKNSYIWCVKTWKSRFSHDKPETKVKCTFDALLRLVAGFLLTRQNSYILCIITWKSRFSHDEPKKCKFVALLPVKAGFSWCAKKVQICCIVT